MIFTKTFRAVAVLAMLAGFAVAVSAPTPALAWRDDGHRITCHIAMMELTPKARAELARLIQMDPVTQVYGEACIWPDALKYTTFRESEPWHYMNFAADDTIVDMGNCPEDRGCLLSAINRHIAELEQDDLPDIDKLRAVKFLGHWLGDVHQPLHMGSSDDRGGNWIHVIWQPSNSPISPVHINSQETNIHKVWDDDLLQVARMQPYHYAARLWMGVTDADRETWLSGSSPLGWAQESRDIALAPSTRYLGAQPGQPIELGFDYAVDNLPVVEARLQAAGVRLGALLNRLLDK